MANQASVAKEALFAGSRTYSAYDITDIQVAAYIPRQAIFDHGQVFRNIPT